MYKFYCFQKSKLKVNGKRYWISCVSLPSSIHLSLLKLQRLCLYKTKAESIFIRSIVIRQNSQLEYIQDIPAEGCD